MQAMHAAARTIFVQFYTAGVVTPVLVRVVVALIALGAFQCNEHAITFFSHGLCVLLGIWRGKQGADLNRLPPRKYLICCELKSELVLLNNLGDNASADGATAFAYSESGTGFHRHRHYQLHVKYHAVAWHDHFHAFRQCH